MSPSAIPSALEAIRMQGLFRELKEVEGPGGRVLRHRGREYLNFSSNNYLGLADHPAVLAAFLKGAQEHGVGSGAARLVTGSFSPFHRLERALAEFKGTEAALVFNSGYQANVGALSCLAGEEDVIFSDALNHASMIDGIRLSRAGKVLYRHNDVEDLRKKLLVSQEKRKGGCQFLIATESVFSMDGDLCRLKELFGLAEEFDAILYLDEAHATGVFGKQGGGLAELLRNRASFPKRVIQMGTLGKALGCFGAYVAATRDVVDYLINRARTFIYSTALPPAVAEASLAALVLVSSEPERRRALWDRIGFFQEEIRRELPQIPLEVESPIIPIILGESILAVKMSESLNERGFWVSAIRPPTVPEGTSRLRIALMATHSEEDVRRLILALKAGWESAD